MKLKDANLNVSALANVDQLIESMLVDESVNGVFISFITSAIHDVKTAVTHAAHDAKTAVTSAAHDVKTAVTHAAHVAKTVVIHMATADKDTLKTAIGGPTSIVPKNAEMTKNIALKLKNNSVEALTLHQLLTIRKEALN